MYTTYNNIKLALPLYSEEILNNTLFSYWRYIFQWPIQCFAKGWGGWGGVKHYLSSNYLYVVSKLGRQTTVHSSTIEVHTTSLTLFLENGGWVPCPWICQCFLLLTIEDNKFLITDVYLKNITIINRRNNTIVSFS